jgi:hypothetical protein
MHQRREVRLFLARLSHLKAKCLPSMPVMLEAELMMHCVLEEAYIHLPMLVGMSLRMHCEFYLAKLVFFVKITHLPKSYKIPSPF